MEKIAYEFKKGDKELIRASVSDFGGKQRADIRTYFQTEDGAWHPTKRGVSIFLDQLGQLETAVAHLIEEAAP